MILVSKKAHSTQNSDDKQTLNSSKIVSLFLKRSKKSNIANRVKKMRFFQKQPGALKRKRKTLGRIQFIKERDLYMKSHRFSKFGM